MLDTGITQKKWKNSHGLEDEGTKGFCVGFSPPFALFAL